MALLTFHKPVSMVKSPYNRPDPSAYTLYLKPALYACSFISMVEGSKVSAA